MKRYVSQFHSVNIVVATPEAGHVLRTLLVGVIAFNLTAVADEDLMLKTQRADLHSDDCRLLGPRCYNLNTINQLSGLWFESLFVHSCRGRSEVGCGWHENLFPKKKKKKK